MSEDLTTPEINEAWDRIARTADGQTIYRHLMRLVMAPAPNDSALPRHEGARNLAANLMRLMAKGIVDSDRYCVAFVTRAVDPDSTRARGAGRRVSPNTFVAGYDTSDTSPSPGGNGPGASGAGSTNGAGGPSS